LPVGTQRLSLRLSGGSGVGKSFAAAGEKRRSGKRFTSSVGIDHILAEEFLAAAVFFQLQLLAYNLVQVFKAEDLDRSWWVLRMKQLRYRLINIAGVVVRHARKTVLRLSIHYRHLETFQRVFENLQIRPVEMRL